MVRATKDRPGPTHGDSTLPAQAPLRPIARRALAAQSDERLVKLVREGHEPAFEEMVRRYRGPLVGFAAAIVSADGAEDVVQASLAKAHRALLADSREITLRPWLFAIVRNGALNAIRGEPRVDELGEAMAMAAGPSEIAEQRDDLDRLVVAMCALPEAQRQALVKRELEGVGHGEIAAQLGTTATAVRGLIFRARVGLRDALGALVPLPLLRSLLAEAPAAGLVGGAGAGAAALVGGGAAKGGTAIAAAIVALGTGIAIDQGREDEPSRAGDVATIERPLDSGRVSGASRTAAAPPTGSSDQASAGSRSEESDRSGEDGSGSGGESEDDDSDSGEGAEPGSEGATDAGGSGDDSAPGPEPDDGGDDNSGPGGGSAGAGGSGSSSPDEGVDDVGVIDSGSRSSGSGTSGSGSILPPPEPPPPPEIGDDSSSSGSGSGDSSGSGDDG